MTVFGLVLCPFLIVCALTCVLSKRVFTAVLIFMSYSLIMSVIWLIIQSPDLAITEAAVGAGVTSVLFFLTLKKVNALKGDDDDDAK